MTKLGENFLVWIKIFAKHSSPYFYSGPYVYQLWQKVPPPTTIKDPTFIRNSRVNRFWLWSFWLFFQGTEFSVSRQFNTWKSSNGIITPKILDKRKLIILKNCNWYYVSLQLGKKREIFLLRVLNILLWGHWGWFILSDIAVFNFTRWGPRMAEWIFTCGSRRLWKKVTNFSLLAHFGFSVFTIYK